MDHASELAVLSSIRAQLDDLEQRLTTLADAFAGTPDSQVAAELFNAERALRTTARSVDRAADALTRTWLCRPRALCARGFPHGTLEGTVARFSGPSMRPRSIHWPGNPVHSVGVGGRGVYWVVNAPTGH